MEGLTESASYTYDLQRRIVTSSQTTNGTSIQRRFAYDRWGNRTGVWDATSGGNQIQSVSLTQSGGVPTNQITSVTTSGTLNYSYDAAGNVTNDGVNTWVYDAENRIVSRNSGTDQFQYDHANRRIKKTSSASGAAIHYVWQGSQVIAEHNSTSGAVIVDYIYAGGRMIAKEESSRSFFLNDRLSVRAVITDGQGGIQGRQSHLPFGEEIALTGQQEKRRFTNYETDNESATSYSIRRQYAQQTGRYLQTDSIAGSASNPQRLNRYAYTLNDPINYIDPAGSDPMVVCTGYYVCQLKLSGDTWYWDCEPTGCEERGGHDGGEPDQPTDLAGGDTAGGGTAAALGWVDQFFRNHKNCAKKFRKAHLVPGGPSLYDQIRSQARQVTVVSLETAGAEWLSQTPASLGWEPGLILIYQAIRRFLPSSAMRLRGLKELPSWLVTPTPQTIGYSLVPKQAVQKLVILGLTI